MYEFHSMFIHFGSGFGFSVLNHFHRFQRPLCSIMWSLQLLVALSGLAATVVLAQNSPSDFASPPPIPGEGRHSYLQACLRNLVLAFFGVFLPRYKMLIYPWYLKVLFTLTIP